MQERYTEHTHTHVYLTKQATRKGEAPIVLNSSCSLNFLETELFKLTVHDHRIICE